MKKNLLHLINAIVAAIFSAFIIGVMQLLLFYFNMIEIDHRTVVDRLLFFNVTSKLAYFISFFLIYFILSIFITLVYYVLLKKIRGWLPGAIYGIILWIILYVVIPILTTSDLAWNIYSSETTVISLCMSLLYGIFIGYSISYDYQNM